MDYEIFIVNDASADRTRTIAEKVALSNRNVKLLSYERGPTRRENLAASFKEATGEIIAFVDIDLVSSLRFLEDLVGQVVLCNDIVTGSRYMASSKIKRKPIRLILSILYNFCIRLLFRTHIRDHMCGFKAFKRDAILRLVKEMGYDESLRRGVFWDTELLVRACQHAYKIKEIPIWWRERHKSALYFKREVKALDYVLNFLWRFHSGRLLNAPDAVSTTDRNRAISCS